MAVSTLPMWVYFVIVGGLFLALVPNVNYYLTRMSKLKIQCLIDKPEEQKSSRTIKLQRRINEDNYPLLILVVYVIVSISFCVDNYKILNIDPVIIRVLMGFFLWLMLGFVVLVIGTALMDLLQKRALEDLKTYYNSRHHITLISVDDDDMDEYYDYVPD